MTARAHRRTVQARLRVSLHDGSGLPPDLVAALRHITPGADLVGIHAVPDAPDTVAVLATGDTYVLLPVPHGIPDPDSPLRPLTALGPRLADAIDRLYTGDLLDIADTLTDTIHRWRTFTELVARYLCHLDGYLAVLPEPDRTIARTHVALRGIQLPPTSDPAPVKSDPCPT